MKKILSCILVLLLALSLIACGTGGETNAPSEESGKIDAEAVAEKAAEDAIVADSFSEAAAAAFITGKFFHAGMGV